MIIYIHGANSTQESFNYIRSVIVSNDMCLEYSSKDGFEKNLENMALKIQSIDSIFFIAHSLGGIYALHLANMFPEKIQGAVTLSTPYGGSKVAEYAKYFLPFNKLMQDVGSCSMPVLLANKINIKWPWCNVVTTAGASAFMSEPNDGVVSVASMQHAQGRMETIDLRVNHYEVVLSHNTIDIIKNRLPKL
jgi:pimeloyl-ACP methyl ester carboxylesterase